MKYEGHNSYQSKDMANVKVFADKQMDKQMNRQTNRQAKNNMPPINQGGGIKNEEKIEGSGNLYPCLQSNFSTGHLQYS